MVNAYDLSAGLFARGLTNLHVQLGKAEEHASGNATVEAAILGSRLAVDGTSGAGAGSASYDLHGYTLAAQVHWSGEGAHLAIARLLGEERTPASSTEGSLRDLQTRLEETIAFLRTIPHRDLELGLEREILIENRHGTTRSNGGHFLVAFAIPHFYYHVTSAYTILRNQGVPLRMGDFLGKWDAG